MKHLIPTWALLALLILGFFAVGFSDHRLEQKFGRNWAITHS